MPLRTMDFQDVSLIPNIQNAAQGALVQIAKGRATEIGIRSSLQAGDEEADGVVLLEGPLAGTFMTTEDLIYAPALDVTAITRVVLEPAPQNKSTLTAGDICRAVDRDKNSFLCMAVRNSSRDAIVGYVALDGSMSGQILEIVDYVYLGRAAVVPLRAAN